MSICDVCGNDYDNAFTVRTTAGEELTFDSIECAAKPDRAHLLSLRLPNPRPRCPGH
jgi:hypothetical protein